MKSDEMVDKKSQQEDATTEENYKQEDPTAGGDFDRKKTCYEDEHTIPLAELKEKLETYFESGLTNPEANDRLEKFGPNSLTPPKTPEVAQVLHDDVHGVRHVALGCCHPLLRGLRYRLCRRRPQPRQPVRGRCLDIRGVGVGYLHLLPGEQVEQDHGVVRQDDSTQG